MSVCSLFNFLRAPIQYSTFNTHHSKLISRSLAFLTAQPLLSTVHFFCYHYDLPAVRQWYKLERRTHSTSKRRDPLKTISQQPSKAILSPWALKIPASVVQILAVWLVTVVVFLPTFGNGFQLEWDDQWMLINHELILNPIWDNIWYYLTHYVDGEYFPLNQLYYLLLFQINGFDPMVYHTGSLLLHMINIGLVFVLVGKILSRLVPQIKHRQWIVIFTTILFAIHPLQVEAVAWISASKVLLFAFFTLVSLLIYMKYLANGNYLYLAGAALCYLLGFMSKEQMIILPLLLVLFDVFFKSKGISVRRLALEKVTFFIVAMVLWYYAARSGMGLLDAEYYPWHQRLALGSYCYFTYWFRFLAPVGLLHFYDYPIEVGGALPKLYYGYIVMTGLLSYGLVEWWRSGSRLIVFGLLFTIINLVLVLHVVPSPRTYMAADRFVYLPIIGMALIVGWVLVKAWSYVPRLPGGLVGSMMAGVLILFGVVSYSKTEQWRDSLTLKKEIREHLENKRAQVK